jgi:alpha 1,3-mannosyltransferase
VKEKPVKEKPTTEKPPMEPPAKGSSSRKSNTHHSSSSKDKDKTPSKTPWETTEDLDTALQQLVGKLPGEMHARDILRPLSGSGKEKLRELGLRARAFKDFFTVWEDVHMVQDSQGNAFVREDVIQYIRGTAEKQAVGDQDDASTRSFLSTVHSYEQYRSFMAQFTKILFPFYAPFYPDLLGLKSSFARGGRGIVLTAGDHQAPFLLTTIASFRKLGCDLPIEIMYLGLSDLSDDFRADLEAIPGVITRDVSAMVNDEGWRLAGWAAKPFAMLLSSFREVMFIDADSAFFRNPEVLFDDPHYRETGALFFRDRKILPENKKRWLQQILPQPISRAVRQSRLWSGESGHMQESGVVVVDKWRHFVAMLFVTLLNGPERDQGEGSAGVYEMMYGK